MPEMSPPTPSGPLAGSTVGDTCTGPDVVPVDVVVAGDGVGGDGVAGDGVAGDGVAGDGVAGDGVAGGVAVGELSLVAVDDDDDDFSPGTFQWVSFFKLVYASFLLYDATVLNSPPGCAFWTSYFLPFQTTCDCPLSSSACRMTVPGSYLPQISAVLIFAGVPGMAPLCAGIFDGCGFGAAAGASDESPSSAPPRESSFFLAFLYISES